MYVLSECTNYEEVEPIAVSKDLDKLKAYAVEKFGDKYETLNIPPDVRYDDRIAFAPGKKNGQWISIEKVPEIR